MASSILGILSSFMPVVIKLVLMYLEKVGTDKETAKKFYEFVDAMQRSSQIPSEQRQKYAKQKDRIDAMIKEIEEKEGVKNG